MMEMYAQEDARGGVIEPEGIVEIKFRNAKLIAAMERLDPVYRTMKADATDLASKKALKLREEELLPMYVQVSLFYEGRCAFFGSSRPPRTNAGERSHQTSSSVETISHLFLFKNYATHQ
jgi:Carboxyl transferase domain